MSAGPRRRLKPPTRRTRRVAGFAALPVAIMLTTFAVAGPSYSVFSGTTSNAASSWATGSVTLTNNSGAALFNAAGLKPGDTASKCVLVTSASTVPTSVSLYTSNISGTGSSSLPYYVLMTVTIGTGSSGTNGDCTGYVQGSTLATGMRLDAMPTAYSGTGAATGWSPTAGGDTRVFKFTYTIDSAVPNTLQNSTASATFVWGAQNS